MDLPLKKLVQNKYFKTKLHFKQICYRGTQKILSSNLCMQFKSEAKKKHSKRLQKQQVSAEHNVDFRMKLIALRMPNEK